MIAPVVDADASLARYTVKAVPGQLGRQQHVTDDLRLTNLVACQFPARAKNLKIVIPAVFNSGAGQAGIQPSGKFMESWIPAFPGMTS